MAWQRRTVLLAFGILILSSGCRKSESGADVKQYFGKTQAEIKEIFGEPVPPGAMARFSMGGLKYTREKCPRLPKGFVELQFFFSDAGCCRSIGGVTKRFESPEALLAAIGLGELESKETTHDALGFTYAMPPYDLVQVHRPSSHVMQYDHFIATNAAAGKAPVE